MKVFTLTNWCAPHFFNRLMNRQKRSQDYIELVEDAIVADIILIINATDEPIEQFAGKKVVYFCMEPYLLNTPWKTPENFLARDCIFRHEREHNICEWHLSYDYKYLSARCFNGKYDLISAIQSNKRADVGHRLRLDFIDLLAEQMPTALECFGEYVPSNVKHRGLLPYHEKENGLRYYKYHFTAENNSKHNYFTEKIIDGILMECLVFYWGCPNLEEYLPFDSFIRLDLHDPSSCIDTIKRAVKEDWWAQRINSIRKAKNIILEELQFFPHLQKVLS